MTTQIPARFMRVFSTHSTYITTLV